VVVWAKWFLEAWRAKAKTTHLLDKSGCLALPQKAADPKKHKFPPVLGEGLRSYTACLTDLDSGPDFRFVFSRCLRESISRITFRYVFSVFQAGAVGHAPGPNFGRTLAKHRGKTTYIYTYTYISSKLSASPALDLNLPERT
jgi:hypothetical protein